MYNALSPFEKKPLTKPINAPQPPKYVPAKTPNPNPKITLLVIEGFGPPLPSQLSPNPRPNAPAYVNPFLKPENAILKAFLPLNLTL